MSKKAIIDAMRESTPGMTVADATAAIDKTFEAIWTVLRRDAPVRLPGYGTFSRRLRETRRVRNPRTGEMSTMLAHHVIRFKESKSPKT